MPKQSRFKTKYPGVYYIEGKGARGPERIFYIKYRKDGKIVEEKAGRQFQDAMTPAKAAGIRTRRIEGKELSNEGKRETDKAAKEAEAGRMTIARLWGTYKEQHKGMACFPSDVSRYTRFIEPSFADKEPNEITSWDVDGLRRKTLKGKAAQTIKHVLTLLKRVADLGGGLGFQVEAPAVDNLVTETLNRGELKQLLKTLDESQDIQIAAAMKFALFTGMRRGEIFKLKWSDVDFEKGFIFIRSPKGKKSVHIPLNDSARGILQSHPRHSEHVFVNERGNPFTDPKKRIDVIRKAAGLPKGFRPMHGLRHVYASMLASSGQVDLYTLQRLLTHKSPQMTQRYAHLANEALKKASGVIVDLLKADEGSE